MTRRVVLALAALALASVALYLLVRREERDSRRERRESTAIVFDDRAVRAFRLSGEGTNARFERAGTGWRMTEPVADAVEAAAAEKVLQAAKRSRVIRTIEDPEAPASYGLDPPRASLEVETGRPVPRLDLGTEDPTRQGIFARVEGRPGVLVLGYPDAIVFRGVDPNRLRDPSLTGILSSEVVGTRLERGGVALRLERGAGGFWITEPRRIPASDPRVDALLGGLERIVPAVLDDAGFPPGPDLGLDPPELRVVLESPSVRRELRFGRRAANGLVPVTRDDRGTLMWIDAAALDRLPLDAKALSDGKLTKANRYDVVAWEDSAEGARATAERSGESDWTSADGSRIAEDRVLGYLARVLEAPVSAIEAGELPTSTPRTIRFRLANGSEDRIRVHRERVAGLDSLPGLVFRLKADLPPPPTGQ